MGCEWRAEQAGENDPEIRPFGSKDRLSTKLFSLLQIGFGGAEGHFPLYLQGSFAVGRGFLKPAFCTSSLNTRFQRHVMMPINAFHLSFIIHHLSFPPPARLWTLQAGGSTLD
jgi:hypothetical protein